ncbi:protein of unknown function [Methylocaldum szegediense]|uniref:Uncharacterized protein n=1 Tax=Methylocaldum szegediense TaxID=73780 RepID=A0ABM9HYQ3_9GAMM|nr:protein of unknown function [Methylocaldum szegediense]
MPKTKPFSFSSLKRDLIKKGLRRRYSGASATVAGLKRDLIKKGLRLFVSYHLQVLYWFETRPD